MVAVIFCTETTRYVNYSVSNQNWTSSSNLYNESNAQNKFAFKCWSFHASNVVHQLPSFCALCFEIFADEVVLLIFVLQTFSWNRSPTWASAEIFPGVGKVDILLVFVKLLATQRKRTCPPKKVQCYSSSCIQCFPCKETLHWTNVCFSELDILRLSLQSSEWVTNFVNF